MKLEKEKTNRKYLPRSDHNIRWWDSVTNSGSSCCFSPKYTIWTYYWSSKT